MTLLHHTTSYLYICLYIYLYLLTHSTNPTTPIPIPLPHECHLALSISLTILASKFGASRSGIIVAGTFGGIHLINAIDDCMTARETGNLKDGTTCAKSVISAGMLFGLGYNEYRRIGGSWTSSGI
ncbi:hypothetical protein BO94DRAFT_539124 [Aspergillus sclerotioniger CBS 115572]|uniref:Uncharacterized protein n=1 Tax=Aspergillus sclerotioniger CBS 115572 TaxID=1450535 RepID=A0A317VDJ5_9EURO|nr:hypothetical protein BO94DRAFT_539124 [Aspergillus sclerotioniger CBS 115572]PWY72444.1 hypothetical protein BO94DRAFT_539124 [Aspergillus sclerotioniger CBS 115572]